ncbi:hypothetical protein PZ59_18725 [Salmonella enterica subsp. enterica serovar Brandenburg]|nr:hypothetical protein [Salmonella enterica subsp. enterica serovar Brandenburg]EFS6326201.1 hypothetical protein [Salmonella enterica subsp. enterica serovar Newport]ECL0907286.1 hypothetical protein [Salmonella enterica subsp. enterica serovar Brandenburg]ECM3412809.1 hypothetical protein [Salmonella enterica subsp. enterica serovar Brandenburg]ECO2157806.1 hypothetical protein [Salmonella enterica subsp. enterica serovar Brandenburg]
MMIRIFMSVAFIIWSGGVHSSYLLTPSHTFYFVDFSSESVGGRPIPGANHFREINPKWNNNTVFLRYFNWWDGQPDGYDLTVTFNDVSMETPAGCSVISPVSPISFTGTMSLMGPGGGYTDKPVKLKNGNIATVSYTRSETYFGATHRGGAFSLEGRVAIPALLDCPSQYNNEVKVSVSGVINGDRVPPISFRLTGMFDYVTSAQPFAARLSPWYVQCSAIVGSSCLTDKIQVIYDGTQKMSGAWNVSLGTDSKNIYYIDSNGETLLTYSKKIVARGSGEVLPGAILATGQFAVRNGDIGSAQHNVEYVVSFD